MEALNELRSALHAPTTKANWSRVRGLLSGYERADFEDVVRPYCQGVVARWPAALRRVPHNWLARERPPTPKMARQIPFLAAIHVPFGSRWAGDTLVEMLGRVDWLPALSHLTLTNALLRDPHLEALARMKHLSGVETLILGNPVDRGCQDADITCDWNMFDAPGLEALVYSPHLARLRHLDLGRTVFEEEGVAVLARSPNLAKLEHLDLTGWELSARGVALIAESEHLQALRSLRLGPVHEVVYEAIAGTPGLARLEVLEIGDPRASVTWGRRLAASPHLSASVRAAWVSS